MAQIFEKDVARIYEGAEPATTENNPAALYDRPRGRRN